MDSLPTSFGKTHESFVGQQLERARRPSSKPVRQDKSQRDGDEDDKDDENDDDEDDDESPEDYYPISHEMILKTHERPVTSLTLDPGGARLITGSFDCTFRLHDFAAMTPNTIRAFKEVNPSETKTSAQQEAHPINHVEFNPHSPGQVLVITASSQAKIFTRDGELEKECVKGDMYLRDMHNTKGHVSEITTATWHPTDRNAFVTAGTDSTLRIWDVNNHRSHKEIIVHKSKSAGSAGRSRMTAVAWSSPSQGGPTLLVAAALDGSLLMWNGNSYGRPAAEIQNAHTPDTWTSGIAVSGDGRSVVTKGGDDTIKLWDTRKFKSPIVSVHHESSSAQFNTSNIIFSPNSSSILTGSQSGSLHILNPALQPEVVTPITPDSPLITVLWHEKINQILTGSANGHTHVLFDPERSQKGAITVMSKAPKRRHIDDDSSLTMDMTQGMSGDSADNYATQNGKGKSNKNAGMPKMPTITPFAKSQPDEEHIRRTIPLASMREEDPREALLKYADKAKNDPLFTNAWKATQPKTIYQDVSDNEDEPEAKKLKSG